MAGFLGVEIERSEAEFHPGERSEGEENVGLRWVLLHRLNQTATPPAQPAGDWRFAFYAPQNGPMPELTLDHLLSLEHAGWAALCEGRGAAHFGDLMTSDAIMVLANGMVMDRASVVASLDEAPPWDSYEISEPTLVELGEDAAALIYRASAVRSGSEPFVALMSSAYRIVAAEPRLALYQQTTATD